MSWKHILRFTTLCELDGRGAFVFVSGSRTVPLLPIVNHAPYGIPIKASHGAPVTIVSVRPKSPGGSRTSSQVGSSPASSELSD